MVGRNGGSDKLSVDAACICTCTRFSNATLNGNVYGSPLCCGCMVSGSIAKAVF